MSDMAVALTGTAESDAHSRPRLDHDNGIATILIFLALLAGGVFFSAWSLYQDVSGSGDASNDLASVLAVGSGAADRSRL
jgi:PiT family inorganic phosphate transporter